MQARALSALLALTALAGAAAPARAHFQMLLPSDDIVEVTERRQPLALEVRFWHPFEGQGMDMERPEAFGVRVAGETLDLLERLQPRRYTDLKGRAHQGFLATYRLRMPGDHVFYVVPRPYWEPSEQVFIRQIAKVVVSAYGLEEGWDEELGLPAEIIPLSRPYGLYAGNVFQGIVKRDGKPVPYATVEVEYYNADGSARAEVPPLATQFVKADANGVFTYGIPRAGWWGFSALVDSSGTLPRDGQPRPLELGAVIWVRAHPVR